MANSIRSRLWALLTGGVLLFLFLLAQALISGILITVWAGDIPQRGPVSLWQGIISFISAVAGILGADALLRATFKANYPRKILLRIVFWFWLVTTAVFIGLFVYYLRFELLLEEDVVRSVAVVVSSAFLLGAVKRAKTVSKTADEFGPNTYQEERVPLVKGLWQMMVGAAVILPQLFFFVWGLVQLAAVYAQINSLWHLPGFFTFIVSLTLSYIPIVGTIVGFFGAKDVWGWEWWQAALLYFGGPILLIVLAIVVSSIASVAERASRAVPR